MGAFSVIPAEVPFLSSEITARPTMSTSAAENHMLPFLSNTIPTGPDRNTGRGNSLKLRDAIKNSDISLEKRQATQTFPSGPTVTLAGPQSTCWATPATLALAGGRGNSVMLPVDADNKPSFSPSNSANQILPL